MQQNTIENTPRCTTCGKFIADDELVTELNTGASYGLPPLILCDVCLAEAEAGSYAAEWRDRLTA